MRRRNEINRFALAMYTRRIKAGEITIEVVPEYWREAVQAKLNEDEATEVVENAES